MKKLESLLLLTVLALSANSARADGTSYANTLASPEDTFEVTLTLASSSDVTLQTYGFGGGTNQAGTLIAPGGTDPFVGLFLGTGDSATFINGTSLDLSNYSSFVGCPPAGTVSNFGGTTCGDVTMLFPTLAAGTYTVLLSDGQFIPNAAFGGGTLGDGFVDFTSGFCNLADFTNGVETDCPNTSGAFALDVVTGPSVVTTAPEPSSLLLFGTGLLGVIGIRRCREC
jgi:PEP-CTERM motif